VPAQLHEPHMYPAISPPKQLPYGPSLLVVLLWDFLAAHGCRGWLLLLLLSCLCLLLSKQLRLAAAAMC